jgi:quercetin dioxygenase-like cupin family protein
VPVADLKFAAVPNAPGVQAATLNGDPERGASHFMLKIPAGFTEPAHHQTASHAGTVMGGTLDLTVEGKEWSLPAGSFFSMLGGALHGTRCEGPADCVLFMAVKGKWDVIVEGTVTGPGSSR